MSPDGRQPATASNNLTLRALEREAGRLFPVLAKKGAFAMLRAGSGAGRSVRIGGGKTARGRSGEVWIVLRPQQKKPSAVCEAGVLEQFSRLEWVSHDSDGVWRLAPPGRAWLARRQGGEDGYRAQHQMIVAQSVTMPDGSIRPVRVNEGENPLGWLRRRTGADGKPLLSDDMVAAGDRLRQDFTRARMAPGITTDWSRIQVQGSGSRSGRANGVADLSDSALAARQRFTHAVNAVGPEMANIVIDVCCFLTGLGEAEKARGWPRRSAKLVLRLALDILARHYGITGPRHKAAN